MANRNCTDEDKFPGKDGTCCDQCAAGQYMQAQCDRTKTTQCAECGRELFTATKNHLTYCMKCKDCSPYSNQKKLKDCTAQENTVCECVSGYYCSGELCEHCLPVTHCTLGLGVRYQATRINNTSCAKCEDGTYSNVTDFLSPCRPHTRCDIIGKELKTAGTSTTDAVCGNFITHCHWILPAGLWSGLVLTALVLFGLIYWRAKRKSYKAEIKRTTNFLKPPFKSPGAGSCVSITLVDMPPAALFTQQLPFLHTEQNGHCQETCKLPLFNPDDNEVTQDSVDSSIPITPLKASVSFAESTLTNGSGRCCTSNFLRTYSEPQEDEWCGT